MTKKKNIFVKLFVALVALTLISCCFLGSTFARYTSGGSGSAFVDIAKWDIALTSDGSAELSEATQIEFAQKLSPDIDGTFSNSANNRVNKSEKQLVAVIENKGDVAATVTITKGDLVPALSDSKQLETGTGITTANSDDAQSASEEQFAAVFTLTLYQSTTESAEKATAEVNGPIQLAAATEGADGGKVYIYAEISWTSQDNDSTQEIADAIDTWFGKYLTSISFTVSYRAVQASEIPNNPNA